jgi:uncharacterized membrane protein (UPF0127 family)
LTGLLLWLGVALAGAPAQLVLGGATVTAEVVDTPVTRAQGLMGRASMPKDTGMLFVYPDEGIRSFWMKDTPLPLSIAFIDQQGRVVSVAELTPFDTTPKLSELPAMYALEMTQGWFKTHDVQVGQPVAGLPGPSNR